MNGRKGVYNIWPKVAPEIQIAISRVSDALIGRHRRWLKSRGIVLDCTIWEMTGCTTIQFYEHFEAQFEAGMTWFSYGQWQIDHIFPLASVDPKSTESILAAFHYTNLRPIWASQNSKKGATVTTLLADRAVFVRNHGSWTQPVAASKLRLT